MNKCDICEIKYESIMDCGKCFDNHIPRFKSFYKPKPDPLQNLFKGCPVITQLYITDTNTQMYDETWLLNHIGINDSSFRTIRLPTIEESPRNTWLAHNGEDKCPDSAENLPLLVWYKDSSLPSGIKHKGIQVNAWKNVERFMMIDKDG